MLTLLITPTGASTKKPILVLPRLVTTSLSMTKPNLRELNESIELLSNYHQRLENEVVKVSKKLQMSKAKIISTLEENEELIKLKKALNQLIIHRDKQMNLRKERNS